MSSGAADELAKLQDLAYEQLETTGRALLSPIVARQHVKGEQLTAVDDFQKLRARPSYTLAARILGYDAIPDFDMSGGVRQS